MRVATLTAGMVALLGGVAWGAAIDEIPVVPPPGAWAGAPAIAPGDSPSAQLYREGGPRWWLTGEVLLWWPQGQRVPPLVTTSPVGTSPAAAGVLGTGTTSVLYGGTRIDDEMHVGGRFSAGYWLSDCHDCGIGGSFFFLGEHGEHFHAESNGDLILARPIFDVTIPGQSSEITAAPGVAAGAIDVFSSTQLLGADAFLRKKICCGSCYRLDVIGGYRYLFLHDELEIDETLTSIGTGASVPVDTTFDITDRFATWNHFHGGNLGLLLQYRMDQWSVELMGQFAIGATIHEIEIGGVTTVTVPGAAPVTQPGGFLTLSSNSGRFTNSSFSLVPEFRISVGYQLTERLRAFVGYDFLYWTNVVRAGDQVNLNINPNLLPPAIPGGPAEPSLHNHHTDFWAQGINLGLSLNY